jgi:bile acid:Na+ symporter, BASS family
MVVLMSKIIKKFSDPMNWYFLVLIIALPAGLLFPDNLSFLANNSTFILSAIFFLGALKINVEDIKKIWKLKISVIIFNILMLVVLPIIVYIVAEAIVPNYALALLILSTMPSGMATPLLASIVGGRESLAMVMTATTSLLAPFTIPFLIYKLAGVSIDVNFWQMFLSIAKVIFIPFLLAWLVRYFFPKTIEKTKGSLGKISTVFLGLLMAGVVAQQSGAIMESLISSELFKSLAVVSILMAFFYILGYLIYFKQKGEDRLTFTVSFANMNFTLAIYLAHKYFTNSDIVVPITLAVIPWFLFIILFKYITRKQIKSNLNSY